MTFPLELLNDQAELLRDEMMYAEGEELIETKKRLLEVNQAIKLLENF